jgi:hypothetical protein
MTDTKQKPTKSDRAKGIDPSQVYKMTKKQKKGAGKGKKKVYLFRTTVLQVKAVTRMRRSKLSTQPVYCNYLS